MYFWKADNLVEDFKNNSVTEKEQFKYMLLFSLIIVLICSPIFSSENQINHYDYIDMTCEILITIWGTYYCYQKNVSGDNKQFLSRFFCLGLPVAIRTIVFFISILIVGGLIEGFLFTEQDLNLATTPISVLIISLYSFCYYLYLSKYIVKVSRSMDA